MAISRVNPVSTSSVNAVAVSTTTANVQKSVTRVFTPGVYEISVSPASSVAIVQFVSGSTFIGQTQTSSGNIKFNLATEVDKVFVQSNNVNDVVTINLTASVPVASAISGTLDTITSNGTYTQTGLLWVLAIGGGGGGASARSGYGQGGSGGLTGAMSMFYGNVSTPTTVTIGTGGAGGVYQNAGAAGTTTSFGTYAVAIGGNGGNLPGGGGNGAVATGTSSGTAVVASTSGILTNNFKAIINGTTGGGGNGAAGGGNGTPTNGSGSGIGTGGNSAVNTAGGNGTGYGSGGGGGSANGSVNTYFNGGAGAPGVIYVLRGF